MLPTPLVLFKKKSQFGKSPVPGKNLNVNLHSRLKFLLPPPVLPTASPPTVLVLRGWVGVIHKERVREGSTDGRNSLNKVRSNKKTHLPWWTLRKPSCQDKVLINGNKLSEAARNSTYQN